MSINSTLQIGSNTISQAAYHTNNIAQNIANIGAPDYKPVYLEASLPEAQSFLGDNDVNFAQEFTNLISNEYALAANAKVITAADTMYGTVLNLKT